MKKRMMIEKERQMKRELDFLKRFHLEDFHVLIRPEHKKILDIQENNRCTEMLMEGCRSQKS